MHPHHRLTLKDWLDKIHTDVVAAQKFEKEDLEADLESMLPNKWTAQSMDSQWTSVKSGVQ